MATYYVSSVDGSNSDSGADWTNAVATLEYAVETLAATGGPHTILVDSAHSESLSADTTITAAQDLRIISVNRSGSDAPLAGAKVGAQATNYSITLTGAFDVYVYGMTFSTGTNTNVAKTISVNLADGGHFELESCTLDLNAGANSRIDAGVAGTSQNNYTKIIGGSIKLTGATHTIRVNGFGEMVGVQLDPAGTSPTTLFGAASNGTHWTFEGCDLSDCTGTLVPDFAAGGTAFFRFVNCKLGSGVTMMATPTSVLNRGQTTVEAFNCASGDTHYGFYHGDAFGETTAVVTYYADDGASYDGTNRCSWKITTRASNCSFFTPYVSPWIEQYNADLSTSIQPYLEGLRVDSTTVIQDDEVWAEFSRQGTSGYPQAVLSSDRMTPLGTPANQTSSLTYANWTGSPTDTDSADSVFKLQAPAAFTPSEIGPLKARVVVGEPSLTIYIDPQIRT